MGDVLHALPAVAALRQAEPKTRIDWAIDPRWAPLLISSDERGSIVDMVHLVPAREWNKAPFSLATLRSALALRNRMREEHYDLVVDMQGTVRSAVIGHMAHADAFAGYSDPREHVAWLYSRKIKRQGTHVVDQAANLLGRACDFPISPIPITLPKEAWAEHWAEHDAVLTRPMCVLAAGGGWAAKHWPVASYGKLAHKLTALGFDVVVNAPREDDPTATAVVAASDGAATKIVCNVAGLIALLRRTDLLIGGDSGPTHLAAALAVPLIALFGPTDPARNGPWGPGQMRVLRHPSSVTSYKHVATPDPGLERISVEEVLKAATEISGK
jgi:heptosyltransferase-1